MSSLGHPARWSACADPVGRRRAGSPPTRIATHPVGVADVAYRGFVTGRSALPPAVRGAVLTWYAARARTFPFRGTTDPYAILVSEAMAQQTQAARARCRTVERVA